MSNFNTIHIFGYGETQIIGEVNTKVDSNSLTNLTNFVDHVKTFLPATGVTLTDYYVIHIFNNMDVRYLGRSAEDHTLDTSFTVSWELIDKDLLNLLIDDIVATIPQ